MHAVRCFDLTDLDGGLQVVSLQQDVLVFFLLEPENVFCIIRIGKNKSISVSGFWLKGISNIPAKLNTALIGSARVLSKQDSTRYSTDVWNVILLGKHTLFGWGAHYGGREAAKFIDISKPPPPVHIVESIDASVR